jgi:membrane associated rhomboid family serine protease
MGLYDRDYMRDEEPGFRPSLPAAPWSPTVALLIVLVVLFIVHGVVANQAGISWNYFLFGLGPPSRPDPVTIDFGLSLAGLREGKIWQLFTFQFLHGGIAHLVMNGLALFSFGRFLERELGRGKYLTLYFLSGVAGGLLQVLATLLLRHSAHSPCVGASAGIAGLLGAFMLSHPDLRMFIIPIPFPIRAWTLLWVVLPVSIIGTVFPFGGIAHAAHLGGLLAGGAFIRWTWFSGRREATPPFLASKSAAPSPTKKEAAKDDFMSAEVDPILEKIHAQGIHSLTAREREILAQAQSRIKKG